MGNQVRQSLYENFVCQIAGDALTASTSGETLKESVDRDEKRQVLQTQIAKLQKKIKSEKQLNKQMELNAQLKKLKKELEVLVSCNLVQRHLKNYER